MARATLGHSPRRGPVIVVYTQYSEKDLIKAVPGARWSPEEHAWLLPIAWSSVVQLRGVFGDRLESSQELADWAWQEYNTRVRPALEIRDALTAEGDHVTWRPYQLADVNFMLVARDCLLANEPGTGKTVSTLTAARALHFADGQSLPMLIICPNSVKAHWEAHFSRWFPEATPYLIRGGVAKRRKLLAEAVDDPSAAVIINIESVRLHSRVGPYGSIRLSRCDECFRKQDWYDLELAKRHFEETGEEATGVVTPVTEARCDVHEKELNRIAFQTVICDEVHRIKEPSAKQTRAVWQLMGAETVRQRWALTGTPIANHVGDLWSIMHAVAPHEYTAKSSFVDRYALFQWGDHGGMNIADIRPDTRDELFKFLDPRFRRMLRSVVNPQLPDKIWTTYEVELTPKQRKLYDEIEAQLFARDDNGHMLVAANNLVKNTRLIQLASSTCEVEYLPLPEDADEGTPPQFKIKLVHPSSKIDALMEIMDDFEGHTVAISAVSKQLIDLAEKRFIEAGISCVKITGDVSEWDRRDNLVRFQAGGVRAILFTVQAGGVGIDMTAADTMIRLQRSYSMIDNVQGLGRIDRIGAEVHQKLYVVDIIAPGTVEDDQLDKLRAKEERLETIARDRAALTRAGLDATQLDVEYAELSGGSLL